jgi:hypothetical protein
MARAIVTSAGRRAAYEPLYDIDPQTGASIEVFYADQVLAVSFGTHGAGWFWWSCQPGCLPDGTPIGPFATNYGAYRDALVSAWSAYLPPVTNGADPNVAGAVSDDFRWSALRPALVLDDEASSMSRGSLISCRLLTRCLPAAKRLLSRNAKPLKLWRASQNKTANTYVIEIPF